MINIFQPSIPKESLKLLDEVFKSNWLGRGDLVLNFEHKISSFLGIKKENFHTISSCSDAIFAIMQVSDFEKESKIIIPSNSFPAVPSGIIEAGYIPIVVDINIKTGNICESALKKAFNLNNNIKGIFITDYGGIPNNLKRIKKIIGNNCKIYLDAAASLGTFIDKNFSGKDADFACWSFDAMKLLVCGEGGGVYIKDKNLMNKFKSYTYLGLSPSEKSGIDKAKENANWWEYELSVPGRRSIFTNINAAIGFPQIEMLDKKIEKRNKIRSMYNKSFINYEQIKFIEPDIECSKFSNYFYTILVPNRDNFARFLKETRK